MKRYPLLLLTLSALLAPSVAQAGPLCEPPPPPVCADAVAICLASAPDACLKCEAADILPVCGKCLASGDCYPEVEVCDLVEAACKAAGGLACDAARADCEALAW